MSRSSSFVDDAPINAFHRKLTIYSAGGPFLDGYALTIIGIAFITLKPALDLSTAELGLIATSALAGIFIGGAVFGRLTDRFGRKTMYIADLIALTVLSVACGFVADAWQLIVLRFLLGVAIGADYPIASSLLAEFVPSKHRGRMLGSLFVVWAVGAAAAAAVGWLLSGLGPDAWRFMLASPAIFGVLTLVLRLGTPESPRWLLSQGREAEARAIVERIWGPDADIEEIRESPLTHENPVRLLKQPRYLRRLTYISLFYTAHVIPLFAVYSYGPELLYQLGLGAGGLYLPELIISALFVVGGIPGLWLVDRWGRLPLLTVTFIVMAVAFVMLGAFTNLPPQLAFALLAVYAIGSGASNFIEIIVPNELFPTSVRATATGIVVAVSRIGSVISTFLLPLVLEGSGIGTVMWLLAAVNIVGLVATMVFGEESKGLSLTTASSAFEPSEVKA